MLPAVKGGGRTGPTVGSKGSPNGAPSGTQGAHMGRKWAHGAPVYTTTMTMTMRGRDTAEPLCGKPRSQRYGAFSFVPCLSIREAPLSALWRFLDCECMLCTALTYMRCEDAPGPEPVAPVASGEAPSARAVLVRGRVTTYDVRVNTLLHIHTTLQTYTRLHTPDLLFFCLPGNASVPK